MRAILIGCLLATAAVGGAIAADRPQYGAWGYDASGADLKTKPGDNFFRRANGAWLDRTPIEPDRPGVSLRLAMTDRVEQRLHALMQSAADRPMSGDAASKVGAFYAAFMDEAAIETLGAAPIAPELDAVRGATEPKALAALMGRSAVDFMPSLFGLSMDVDLKDPGRYAVYVSQGGLGLPDRDYYLDAKFAETKTAYAAHVAHILHLIGWPDAEARAGEVVAFETEVAKVSWTKTQQRDLSAIYNPVATADLADLAPGFDWTGFLANAGLPKLTHIIVAEKSAFPKITAVFTATPVTSLAAWHAFHIADSASPYLSASFSDAYFAFHDRTLAGQKTQRARWKRAVYAVAGGDCGAAPGDCFGTLNWAVGRLYTDTYFPPAAKARIEDLVTHLKAAYRRRLERLDWMSPATKAEALKKLDTYAIKVGYPAHQRDYSGVVIARDDLLGDVRRAAVADWSFYTRRLDGPVDRDGSRFLSPARFCGQ